ncbi:uncharacterized protein LOC129940269 [Eupeodes corollae]|uniref:uncharacterized protein LOC129940269 n=1 Tax=Eupeodes corollae TaxID=290404 RepID=UPI00248F7711|nr:uncharacterized protein LOC129940269 [Eupeodes corollae]
MFRGTSSASSAGASDGGCFLVLLVFIILCDFVLSNPYANLSEISLSDRHSRRAPHRQRQRHKKPISSEPAEAPLDGENYDARIPKLFSFEALDEDLMIDLDFAIPFIHVPVKKSMQKTGQAVKSLVNLNTPALILAGLFAAGSAIFGLVFHNYVGKTTTSTSTTPIGLKRNSRITDINSMLDPFKLIQRNSEGEKFETGFGDIFQIVEENFNKNDVDITACIQKSICLYVKKSAEYVRNGRASGTNKIVDGLVSSDWLLQYLEGTAIRDAIDTGSGSTKCGYKYPTCQWSDPEKHVLNIILGFAKNIPALKDSWP